jgi:hypothetical protein
MKLEINVSRLILENIFFEAIEGGSSYWCSMNKGSYKKIREALSHQDEPDISLATLKAVLDHGVTVYVNDAVNGERVGTLSKETFEARLNELANSEDYSYSLFNYLGGSGDANDADIIFQYLCIGEVVYG